ncbi:type VI secretion system lipoprotein TssJ [Ideonella sp. NS12-5]|uniref:Type VI secretion system lipoprotein TssJ n=2 Tax=Ideonella oryzae TaxID=2937441 RepID=A0ABT1BQR3_9BURK|nr:type VI secretion system lipoprotein TssJ [Ideonella oryzae]MCO5978525.1 type VI secretion system lipoprotein TssJ [Ideonella oryzae]
MWSAEARGLGSILRWVAIGLVSLFTTACSTPGTNATQPGVLDSALQMVGLQRVSLQTPDTSNLPALQKTPKALRVVIRLHAGDLLNSDTNGQSLPVVARIYELKEKDAFERAPAGAFEGDKSHLSPELADALLGSREVVLTPGQRYEVTETLPEGTRYIGVLALFRAPAEGRWRQVFDAQAAVETGLTLGVHACALSVANGRALDVAPELTRLAGVQCS